MQVHPLHPLATPMTDTDIDNIGIRGYRYMILPRTPFPLGIYSTVHTRRAYTEYIYSVFKICDMYATMHLGCTFTCILYRGLLQTKLTVYPVNCWPAALTFVTIVCLHAQMEVFHELALRLRRDYEWALSISGW